MSYCRGFCALLLIILTQEAAAQQPGIGPQAAQFLQSKFNRDAINESIRNYSNALPSRCKELEIGTKFNVLVFTPLQFSPDGRRLVAGVWKEQVTVRACGVEKLYNVQTNLRSDAGLQRTNLLPGHHAIRPCLAAGRCLLCDSYRQPQGPGRMQEFRYSGHCLSRARRSFTGKRRQGARHAALARELDHADLRRADVVLMTFTPDATGTTIAATTDRNPK
jgi:hypothetical protein